MVEQRRGIVRPRARFRVPLEAERRFVGTMDPLQGAVIVEESDQIMAIMKSGKVIRSNVAEVKRTGRTTQGVTLAKPDKNDEIISIARNEETDEDDAEQAAAENGAVQNDAAAQSQAETTTENSAETGTEATSDAGDGENVEA